MPHLDNQTASEAVGEPIAVIGSGCRFPGSSDTPSKLWGILRDPTDLLKKIPLARFHSGGFYHPDPSHHGTTNVTESYFLDEDHRAFDAGFFNIKQIEAHAIDPQQRMLIEVVYEALESAGQSIESLAGSQTGVYIGVMCDDYSEHLQRDINIMPTYMGTGTARSIMSNRISYFFDWHGPCMTIDTACSSSLVAVHQAVQLLRSCESDVAVAAGSNLILGPGMYVGESKLKMLSPGSRSRMWDVDADGYARGEGVAAVVLKRLSTAIADGDHIECIIRESGVNQDGRTKGITMPSHRAQSDLIRKTYQKAGLDPKNPAERCQYFEAHGTGTPAGDPREAEAISTAFFEPNHRKSHTDPPLWVGSIKTVIGHTEGTAGIAGLIKASLAVQHGVIPPNRLFNVLNPAVEPFYTNLEIPTSSLKWPTVVDGSPRRASVNSFGFGGTNTHVIVENYSGPNGQDVRAEMQYTPFVFSAASESALRKNILAFIGFLDANPYINFNDLSYTLYARRSALPVRTTVSAFSLDSLRSQLEILTQKPENDESKLGFRPRLNSKIPRVLACFTGQGAQWATMGRELIVNSEYARKLVMDMDAMLQQLPEDSRPGWSLMDEFMADATTSRLNSALVAQPLCTALQIILLDLLKETGVSIQATVGHSSGEIAAAYAAGFLTCQDAMKIAYYRGLFTADVLSEKPGGMMAVGTTEDDASEFCELPMFAGRICVAAINSSASITLSGDLDAIEEAKDIFEDEGKFARILKVDKAYHSSHMMPSSIPYLEAMRNNNIHIHTGNSSCAWFSSTYENTRMTGSEDLSGSYWTSNMTQAVLFAQAVDTASAEEGPFDAVIELGPHPTLKGPVMKTLQAKDKNVPAYTGLLSRGSNDITAFSNAMGYLWTLFNPSIVDLGKLDIAMSGRKSRRFVPSLPRYCWDHDKLYWHETRVSKAFRNQTGPPHSLLGTRMADTIDKEIRWKNVLQPLELPWIHGHQLQGQMVYPAAAYLATALEASIILAGARPISIIELEDFELGKPLTFDTEDSGVETIFSLNNISTTPTSITAAFSYHACSNTESDSLSTHATGTITLILGDSSSELLPNRPDDPPNLVYVNDEQFYLALEKLGYEYSGEFKALSSMRRKKDYGTADILVPTSDQNWKPLLVHPAILDNALQGLFLAYSWPSDGSLDQLHVPIGVKKLRVNVDLCQQRLNPDSHVTLCSYLTEDPHLTRKIRGDVDIYSHDEVTALIQIEGVEVVAFSEPTSDTDRNHFAEQIWNVAAPDCDRAAAGNRASQEDFDLAVALERVSVFYLRQLTETISPEERGRLNLEWHHVCLFNFASHILNRVEDGTLPFAKKSWLNDTREDQLSLSDKYIDRVEMRLIVAVGENLHRAVRRETTILEHLLANNMLDEFYVSAMGVKELTQFLATTVAQLVHRHPRMKVLEIGAGTGGATKAIISKIDRAFSSYTFTDISTGFFEAAQHIFSSLGDKMIFKTLDIEKDIVEQGYEEHSYDLIIGSMVLHATSSLQTTLENSRRLLKPGGYLIMLEITNNDVIRVGFSMSGLPGWWLGQQDGRELSPCVSTAEWHKLLLRSGFSGVDSHTPEVDILVRPLSVIVSQAVDNQFAMLREPLLPGTPTTSNIEWDLVAIGGKTMKTITLIEQIRKQADHSGIHFTCYPSIESLNTHGLSPKSAILLLTELDKPIFQGMSESTMSGMKRLLETQRTILWVTKGRRMEEPYMNMSIGFGRTMVLENPDLRIQFLDLDSSTQSVASRFLEALSRLFLSNLWEKQGKFSNVLWTHEEETAYENGQLLISRMYFSKTLNNRFNATRRKIVDEMDAQQSPLTIEHGASKLDIIAGATMISNSDVQDGCNPDQILVKVEYSILHQIASSPAPTYCVLGVHTETGNPVMAFSNSDSSFVSVAPERVIEYSLSESMKSRLLVVLGIYLQADRIISACEPNSALLVHEPSPILMDILLSTAPNTKVKIMFTTTKSEDATRPWITVHPASSSRALKSILPNHISTFLDLSQTLQNDRVGAIMADCLPATCQRLTMAQIEAQAHAKCHSPADLTAQFTKLAHQAIAYLSESNSSEPAASVTVNELIQMKKPPNDTIVNWIDSGNIPVTISTVESQVHFKEDRTYVMFGLTSDLAQSTCDWMVSRGARNVVLTSRNPNIDIKWIRLLEGKGVKIEAIANDITDKAALIKVVHYIRQTFPPIAGIAHGAMVLDDASFFDMPFEKMQKVLKPKVQGAIYLDELFQDGNLDFFIFFSSVASIVGNRGQSAYSASNMFMVALAAQRRQKGLAASVLHIGAVLGVGYVTRVSPDTPFVNIGKAGFMWMSERGFHLCFGEAVLASNPLSQNSYEIITGMNTMKFGAGPSSPWIKFPRFQHCVLEDENQNSFSNQKITSISVQVQLREVTNNQDLFDTITMGFVFSEIVPELTQPAALFSKLFMALQLPEDTPHSQILSSGADELSIDSLIAVELRSWFLKELEVDMPILKIMSDGPIKDLIEFAVEKTPAFLTPKLHRESEDLIPLVDEMPPVDSGSDTITSQGDFVGSDLPDKQSLPSNSASSPPDSPKSQQEYHDVVIRQFEKTLPMSPGQSRFWFLKHLMDDQTTSNITVLVSMKGTIQLNKFESAIETIGRRHEALRTAFLKEEDQEPMQGIMRVSRLKLEKRVLVDEAHLAREFMLLKNHVYDIEGGECMRIIHLSSTSTTSHLLIGYSHINMDGISLEVFLSDLERAYNGHQLPSSFFQYSEYTREIRRALEQGDLHEERKYWKAEFANHPAPLPLLPFTSTASRSAIERYDHNTASSTIESVLASKIKATCLTLKANVFHFYLTVYEVMLFKLFKTEDLCIGMADANRQDQKARKSMGIYLNLLPLRFRLNGKQSFADILKETRKKAYRAMAHSRLPFDVLLEDIKAPRSTSYSPVFQAFVNYRPGIDERRKFGTAEVTMERVEAGRTPYDINLDIIENPGAETRITFSLQKQLYSEEDAIHLTEIYFHLLDSFSTNPQEIVATTSLFLSDKVKHALTVGRGLISNSKWPETLVHRIEEIAAKHSTEIALKETSGEVWTYADLARGVNRIASTLLNWGVTPQSYVAVFQEPSSNFILSLLAILRVGAIYVPFDLAIPTSRLSSMVAISPPTAIVVDDQTVTKVSELCLPDSTSIVNVSQLPVALAYDVPIMAEVSQQAVVLFTSGSTGIPKGVRLSHSGLINHAEGVATSQKLGQEVVLQQSAFSFDLSLYQITTALANGGSLVIVPRSLRGDSVAIGKIVSDQHVTSTIATPSEYLSWFRYGSKYLFQSTSWRYAKAGGEWYPASLVSEFQTITRQFKHDFHFFNIYGPSETSLSSHEIEITSQDFSEQRLTVGRPLPNYTTSIVDETFEILPTGFAGEICIGGAGVGLGYLNLPDQSRKSFLKDPHATPDMVAQKWTRLYRTGDRGLLHQDGSLEILGRVDGDTQIKLRGYRIELGDVEKTIIRASNGSITEVVVTPRGSPPSTLVAHAVLSTEISPESQIDYLRDLVATLPLPLYMRPAVIVPIEAIPLSTHGKIDRRALEQLHFEQVSKTSRSEEQLTEMEIRVAEIWSQILPASIKDISSLGASTDFFHAGGNSMLLLQLRTLIKESFGIEMTLLGLFERSTLGDIAAAIENTTQSEDIIIDWEAETTVPDDFATIHQDRNAAVNHGPPRNLVLTGATGFLGRHVLENLIASTTVEKIHCIAVRKPDALRELFASEKLHIHEGNLSLPLCGLAPGSAAAIFSEADAIIHNGADVSFLKTYQSLKPSNVASTKELARQCVPRNIPFHFISTATVGQLNNEEILGLVSLSSFPPPKGYTDGYAASKWASEVFLEKVHAQIGIPVVIHRPSSVTGEGAGDLDILSNVLNFAPIIKALPDPSHWRGYMDTISIEKASFDIAKIVTDGMNHNQQNERGVIYMHHAGEMVIPVGQIKDFVNSDEQDEDKWELVPMRQWIDQAKEHGLSSLVAEYLSKLDTGTDRLIGQRLVTNVLIV